MLQYKISIKLIVVLQLFQCLSTLPGTNPPCFNSVRKEYRCVSVKVCRPTVTVSTPPPISCGPDNRGFCCPVVSTHSAPKCGIRNSYMVSTKEKKGRKNVNPDNRYRFSNMNPTLGSKVVQSANQNDGHTLFGEPGKETPDIRAMQTQSSLDYDNYAKVTRNRMSPSDLPTSLNPSKNIFTSNFAPFTKLRSDDLPESSESSSAVYESVKIDERQFSDYDMYTESIKESTLIPSQLNNQELQLGKTPGLGISGNASKLDDFIKYTDSRSQISENKLINSTIPKYYSDYSEQAVGENPEAYDLTINKNLGTPLSFKNSDYGKNLEQRLENAGVQLDPSQYADTISEIADVKQNKSPPRMKEDNNLRDNTNVSQKSPYENAFSETNDGNNDAEQKSPGKTLEYILRNSDDSTRRLKEYEESKDCADIVDGNSDTKSENEDFSKTDKNLGNKAARMGQIESLYENPSDLTKFPKESYDPIIPEKEENPQLKEEINRNIQYDNRQFGNLTYNDPSKPFYGNYFPSTYNYNPMLRAPMLQVPYNPYLNSQQVYPSAPLLELKTNYNPFYRSGAVYNPYVYPLQLPANPCNPSGSSFDQNNWNLPNNYNQYRSSPCNRHKRDKSLDGSKTDTHMYVNAKQNHGFSSQFTNLNFRNKRLKNVSFKQNIDTNVKNKIIGNRFFRESDLKAKRSLQKKNGAFLQNPTVSKEKTTLRHNKIMKGEDLKDFTVESKFLGPVFNEKFKRDIVFSSYGKQLPNYFQKEPEFKSAHINTDKIQLNSELTRENKEVKMVDSAKHKTRSKEMHSSVSSMRNFEINQPTSLSKTWEQSGIVKRSLSGSDLRELLRGQEAVPNANLIQMQRKYLSEEYTSKDKIRDEMNITNDQDVQNKFNDTNVWNSFHKSEIAVKEEGHGVVTSKVTEFFETTSAEISPEIEFFRKRIHSKHDKKRSLTEKNNFDDSKDTKEQELAIFYRNLPLISESTTENKTLETEKRNSYSNRETESFGGEVSEKKFKDEPTELGERQFFSKMKIPQRFVSTSETNDSKIAITDNSGNKMTNDANQLSKVDLRSISKFYSDHESLKRTPEIKVEENSTKISLPGLHDSGESNDPTSPDSYKILPEFTSNNNDKNLLVTFRGIEYNPDIENVSGDKYLGEEVETTPISRYKFEDNSFIDNKNNNNFADENQADSSLPSIERQPFHSNVKLSLQKFPKNNDEKGYGDVGKSDMTVSETMLQLPEEENEPYIELGQKPFELKQSSLSSSEARDQNHFHERVQDQLETHQQFFRTPIESDKMNSDNDKNISENMMQKSFNFQNVLTKLTIEKLPGSRNQQQHLDDIKITVEIKANPIAPPSAETRTEVKSGGEDTRHHQPQYTIGGRLEEQPWPWMAAIYTFPNNRFICAGTLIDETHILSAAHCFYPTPPKRLFVYIGQLSRLPTATPWNNQNFLKDAYIVENLYMHSGFNKSCYCNDIAILKLTKAVHQHLVPVCLPAVNIAMPGENLSVLGWGDTFFENKYTAGTHGTYQLQRVDDLNVFPTAECRKMIYRSARVTMPSTFEKHYICAGVRDGSKDACVGDSGGPLLHEDYDGVWTLAGIVSFGFDCGQPGLPGTYTKVSYFLPWIMSILDMKT